MKIQSLSIVVPGGCPNKCRFCVSCLHPNPIPNQIEKNKRFRDLYKKDFQRRMAFARDNGCNTVMLTGNGEPLINESFLNFFAEWNEKLDNPFRWIEIQTSGVTLTEEKLRWLRNEIGVSVISLSLSSVFNSAINAYYNVTPQSLVVDIDALCAEIKRYDFDLRLSLNMTDAYNTKTSKEILERCKSLGANQVTVRVLYESEVDDEHGINKWIQQHRASEEVLQSLNDSIVRLGRPLRKLPFGGMLYSLDGMSIVIDNDCMSQAVKEEDLVKYLILQPNCKLYTRWDDEGSLLF